MNISGNTVLITGGGTGIGLALAEQLSKAGNRVIICGRREQKLNEGKRRIPVLQTMVGDVSTETGRQELFQRAIGRFSGINILVNSAGVQNMIDLTGGIDALRANDDEIAINFAAPVRLSGYFIPTFLMLQNSAIVNVSSGLGFIPLAFMPVYCATKAALHSFTISLRHQLRNSTIKVFEVIPPTVDTELDRGARARRGQQDRGIHPDEVATATITALQNDQYEVAIGRAQDLVTASRTNPDRAFIAMNH